MEIKRRVQLASVAKRGVQHIAKSLRVAQILTAVNQALLKT
jgi:hypothetical protein